MRTAELTVVIPAHNRAGLLPRTLASLQAQSLRPLKVILVDNASTDSTLSVMRSWASSVAGDIDVTVLEESAPGAAAARNCGLAHVDTEWAMFFDSDDTMTPDHCARAMACSADVDVVGWDVRHRAASKSSIKRFYTVDMQFHSLFHGSMSTQRYMARTCLFRQSGCWNPAIMYWDDIELGARLLALNPRVKHAGPKITVDVFVQAESITGSDYRSRIAPARVSLDAISRTLGAKGTAYTDLKLAILAGDCSREGGPEGRELYSGLIAGKSFARRLLLSFAYNYQRLGGRGTARLLRIFL